jgi:hypothetical protein
MALLRATASIITMSDGRTAVAACNAEGTTALIVAPVVTPSNERRLNSAACDWLEIEFMKRPPLECNYLKPDMAFSSSGQNRTASAAIILRDFPESEQGVPADAGMTKQIPCLATITGGGPGFGRAGKPDFWIGGEWNLDKPRHIAIVAKDRPMVDAF